MEGVDREWNLLSPNTNRISYNNLDYENYTLRISKLNINGKPSEDAYTLEIRISPPWYYTLWAKIIYSLLLAGLTAWIINFFRMKNRLHIERIEKKANYGTITSKNRFFHQSVP